MAGDLDKRPFRILGVQHIAMAGLDKTPLAELWCELLGLVKIGHYRSEQENVDEDITRCGQGPLAVEIDLLQPIDPEAKPRVHAPALNHVGLWVDDLQAAIRWLSARGVRFTPGGIRPGAAGHDICFIHPRGDDQAPIGGSGVLIELVQAPPEIKQAAAPPMARS